MIPKPFQAYISGWSKREGEGAVASGIQAAKCSRHAKYRPGRPRPRPRPLASHPDAPTKPIHISDIVEDTKENTPKHLVKKIAQIARLPHDQNQDQKFI